MTRTRPRPSDPRDRVAWTTALLSAAGGSVVLVLAFAAFATVLFTAGFADGQALLGELDAAGTASQFVSVLQERFGEIAGVFAIAALLAIPMGALTYRLMVGLSTDRLFGPGSALVAALASMLAAGAGWFVDAAFDGLTFGIIGLAAAVVAGAWVVRERAIDSAVGTQPPAAR